MIVGWVDLFCCEFWFYFLVWFFFIEFVCSSKNMEIVLLFFFEEICLSYIGKNIEYLCYEDGD